MDENQQAPPQTAPATESAAPSVPSSSLVEAGAEPTSSAPAVPPSWRDALREHIPDLSSFKDDNEAAIAMGRLYKEHSQFRQYQPYVNDYLANAKDFAEYMRQKGEKGQPKTKADGDWWKEYWNPPEYDATWGKYFQDGRPVQDAPIGIIAKAQEYANFRSAQMEKFASNPFGYLEKGIDHRARTIAEKIVEEKLRSYQDQQFIRQTFADNSSWLMQRDAQGQIMTQQQWNPALGQMQNLPVLNEWGHRYQGHIAQIIQAQEKRGYLDVEEQHKIALMAVQNEYMASDAYRSYLLNQQTAPTGAATVPAEPVKTVREETNQKFLEAAKGAKAGARQGGGPSRTTPEQRLTLQQRMKKNFEEAGLK